VLAKWHLAGWGACKDNSLQAPVSTSYLKTRQNAQFVFRKFIENGTFLLTLKIIIIIMIPKGSTLETLQRKTRVDKNILVKFLFKSKTYINCIDCFGLVACTAHFGVLYLYLHLYLYRISIYYILC